MRRTRFVIADLHPGGPPDARQRLARFIRYTAAQRHKRLVIGARRLPAGDEWAPCSCYLRHCFAITHSM
jgi:hypothetical protein